MTYPLSVEEKEPEKKPSLDGVHGESNAPWTTSCEAYKWKIKMSPEVAVTVWGSKDKPCSPTSIVCTAALAREARRMNFDNMIG